MENLIVLTILLIVSTSTIDCFKSDGIDFCNAPGYGSRFDEKCLRNGTNGFVRWDCEKGGRYPWTWVNKGAVLCRLGEKCRCEEWDDWWMNSKCHCYNAKKFPKFPATGRIQWSGTKRREDDSYSNKRTVPFSGFAVTDSKGNSLKVLEKVGRFPRSRRQRKKLAPKTTLFSIIMPNEDNTISYYSGKGQSKTCKRRIIADVYAGKSYRWIVDLSSIYRDVPGDVRINKITPLSDDVDAEVWQNVNEGEDGIDKWVWKLDYYKKEGHGIPKSFYYLNKNWFDQELEETNIKYTYIPERKGEVSFRLEDYCTVFIDV